MLKKVYWSGLLLLVYGISPLNPGIPQLSASADDFQERVDKAIAKGAEYLVKHFDKNALVNDMLMSPTLPLYAIIHANRKEDRAFIDKNLKELMAAVRQPNEQEYSSYTWSISAMAFALADAKKYGRELDQIKEYLIKGQDPLGGWGYDQPVSSAFKYDSTSATQFVALGLHACWRKDHPKGTETVLTVPHAVWEKMGRYWLEAQLPGGGWGYFHPKNPVMAQRGLPNQAYPNMTTAGISSLSIIRAHVKDKAMQDQIAKAIDNGVKWLEDHFSKEKTIFISSPVGYKTNTGYYLYSLEKAADLAGLDKIGSLDWYRTGADALLKWQKSDGSWGKPELMEALDNSLVTTSFAILFLKRASGVIITGDKRGDWKGIDTQGGSAPPKTPEMPEKKE